MAERRGSKRRVWRPLGMARLRGLQWERLCTVPSRRRADTTASFCALANEQVEYTIVPPGRRAEPTRIRWLAAGESFNLAGS